MRNSQDLDKLKDLIKEIEFNNDYNIEFKTLEKGNYSISINKVVKHCYLCNSKFHISRLELRQDKRVQNLIIGRLFCLTCRKKVDKALELLKDSIPKHLQPYTQ